MRRTALVAAVLLSPACAAAPAGGPEDAVEALYSVLVSERVSGAPSEAQLQAMSPFITDTLRSLLAGALRLQLHEAALYPDEKPPFVEGDLFSSMFEGPTRFSILDTAPDGAGQRVRVEFVYDREPPETRWIDAVIVVQQGGRWVVGDVVYGGEWDFAATGSLRSALEGVLTETPPPQE